MENYNKLKQLVNDIEIDVNKFERGSRAPGARIRKAMQEAKVLAQQIRIEVTTAINSKK